MIRQADAISAAGRYQRIIKSRSLLRFRSAEVQKWFFHMRRKKYSIDSTMEELLNHPDIRAFLSQMMEVDMIPDIAYGLSLRDVAKTFAGEIKKDEAQMLDAALAKF